MKKEGLTIRESSGMPLIKNIVTMNVNTLPMLVCKYSAVIWDKQVYNMYYMKKPLRKKGREREYNANGKSYFVKRKSISC